MSEKIFIQIHRLSNGEIDTSRIPLVGQEHTSREWENVVKRLSENMEAIPALMHDDGTVSILEPKK